MAVGRNGRNLLDQQIAHGKDRLRVAHAERLELIQPTGGLGRDKLGCNRAVNVQNGHELLRVDMLPRPGLHIFMELLNILLADGQSGGQFVSAEAFKQRRAVAQRFIQVKALDRPSRTLANAVLQCNQHGRAGVAVTDARRDNTNYTMVPVLSGQHDDLIFQRVILPAQLLQGLFQNLVFGRLPLLVLLAQRHR